MKTAILIVIITSIFHFEANASICDSVNPIDARNFLADISRWCPAAPYPEEVVACATIPENATGMASKRELKFVPSDEHPGAFRAVCQFYHCDGFRNEGLDTIHPLHACLIYSHPPDIGPVNANACTTSGSIIENVNQVVGEKIPVVGVPFDLVYFSKFARGYKSAYKINIPITKSSVDPVVINIALTLKDENGSVIDNQMFSPIPNQDYNYEWDGLDANSLETWGQAYRLLTIQENTTTYDNVFDIPSTLFFGNLKAKKLGIGGWLPSIWKFYDNTSKMLISGDGATRRVSGTAVSSGMRVADESGKYVYYFDSVGRITHTKTALTGTTIFTFDYDSSGRLLSITQPFGLVSMFSRNIFGELVSITAPNGKITEIDINTNGYLEKVTNPKSEIYSMTYYGTTGGLLNTFTKPTGDVTTLIYDINGNLTSDTHSNGFSVTLDKVGDVVTSTTGEGVVSTNTFTKIIGLETLVSSFGTTTYVSRHKNYLDIYSVTGNANYILGLDPRFGNQVNSILSSSIDDFGNRSSSFTKDVILSTPSDPYSITTLTTVEDIGSSQNTSVYDGLTKTWTNTTKLGRTISSEIDIYERPVSTKKGTLTSKTYTYTNDLLTKINHGVSRETSLTYYSNKLLQTVTNALNEVTSYTYDNAERLLTTTLPDLRVISYNYDSNGNLTSITPPGKPAHIFTFGLNEKLENYTPPTLTGVANVNTQYSYDLDKRLIKIERPDGKDIDLSYDITTGLLSTISGIFGTINHTYDNGRVNYIVDQYGSALLMHYLGKAVYYTHMSDADGSVYIYSRTPDAVAGQKISSESVNGAEYSSVNRIIDYTYDDDEFLTGSGAMSLTYNTPNGQLTGTSLANIEDYYYYNTFGEVIQHVVKKGTPVIYQYDLERDSVGRVTKKTELLNGVTTVWDYTYDSVGRLIQIKQNSVIISTYSYDSNSNRNGGVVRGNLTIATYDNQDRLLSYNGVSRSYNANGELTTLGTKTTTYDIFGNLKQFVDGTTTIDYEIDPLQRRLGRIINAVPGSRVRYIFNPEGKLVGELNHENKLIKTFVYGSKAHVPDYYIDESGAEFRIVTDHLGSVRMVVNASSGVVLQYMEHDEFGVVLQDTNPGLTPFGFAGGLYSPESGLVRFGARDYDPETGRWTSKDPIRFNGGDANLYGYVVQDPINNIDPPGTGPISGGFCYLLDIGYNASQASAEFINQSNIAGIYEQQIRNIQNQMNSSNSCAADKARLQSEITVLQQQKNAALAQATNSLIGSIGTTVGGGIVCKGISSLPGI